MQHVKISMSIMQYLIIRLILIGSIPTQYPYLIFESQKPGLSEYGRIIL